MKADFPECEKQKRAGSRIWEGSGRPGGLMAVCILGGISG